MEKIHFAQIAGDFRDTPQAPLIAKHSRSSWCTLETEAAAPGTRKAHSCPQPSRAGRQGRWDLKLKIPRSECYTAASMETRIRALGSWFTLVRPAVSSFHNESSVYAWSPFLVKSLERNFSERRLDFYGKSWSRSNNDLKDRNLPTLWPMNLQWSKAFLKICYFLLK